jgi:hypothetical protein
MIYIHIITIGLRSLNSSVNGSFLLYYTSPRLCAVSLAIVPLVGVGAMTMSKFSRKLGKLIEMLDIGVSVVPASVTINYRWAVLLYL